MKDSAVPLYAKLGLISDQNASPLRIKKSGNTFAVLTKASLSGQLIDQYNYAGGNLAALNALGWSFHYPWSNAGINFYSEGAILDGWLDKAVPQPGTPVSIMISGETSGYAWSIDEMTMSIVRIESVNIAGTSRTIYDTSYDTSLPEIGNGERAGKFTNKVINLPADCVKVRISGSNGQWSFEPMENLCPWIYYHRFFYT
ncbi:hypothetical protein [Sporomusa sp. GT1]|uniref:hypothetical protein n=1 Tax=Sporomusa sp. GT1 TaxID=1534747 RepID=UPI001CB82545|nr:hypothetical protein [Sporomusa sp. GT1]